MNIISYIKNQLWSYRLLGWILSLQTIFYIVLLFVGGYDEEHLRIAVRLTARLAVILFCLAFGASAIHYFFKNSFTYWLRMNRRILGIAFAITHLLHLSLLIVLQYTFHPVFELAPWISLFGGGMAYFFVIVMLLTSFPRLAGYFSSFQWKMLHTIGGYWIWFIFLRTYGKKALGGHSDFIPYFLLVLMCLAIRLLHLYILNKSKPQNSFP